MSERYELKMSAVSTEESILERSALDRVVFPVPIPPVITINPFFSLIP